MKEQTHCWSPIRRQAFIVLRSWWRRWIRRFRAHRPFAFMHCVTQTRRRWRRPSRACFRIPGRPVAGTGVAVTLAEAMCPEEGVLLPRLLFLAVVVETEAAAAVGEGIAAQLQRR